MKGLLISCLFFLAAQHNDNYKDFYDFLDKYYQDNVEECIDGIVPKKRGLSIRGNEDLLGDDLSGKDLSNRNLSGINFSGKDLSGASFKNSILDDANFSDSNLTDATLELASAKRTRFTGSTITRTDFTAVCLYNNDFTGANTKDARLENTVRHNRNRKKRN